MSEVLPRARRTAGPGPARRLGGSAAPSGPAEIIPLESLAMRTDPPGRPHGGPVDVLRRAWPSRVERATADWRRARTGHLVPGLLLEPGNDLRVAARGAARPGQDLLRDGDRR